MFSEEGEEQIGIKKKTKRCMCRLSIRSMLTEHDPDWFDHDLDWPWTLYFNGEAVARWANCWNLCEFPENSSELFMEHTWIVDYSDFVRLCNRMDLAHTIDSEDPVLFRIQSLSLLVLLLRQENRIKAKLAPLAAEDGTTPNTIFEGIRDGVAAMHRLVVRDQFAFWTVGYEGDGAALLEAVRQSPPTPSLSGVVPPHIRDRNRGAEDRLHSLRCELLELLRAGHYPKDFRRFIHELPTRV